MRLNERKELHKISETRVSKWPNTITAERERKEYERIKKLEDDEVSQFVQINSIHTVSDGLRELNLESRSFKTSARSFLAVIRCFFRHLSN